MGRQITWKEISQSQPSFKAKPVCFRPQGRAPSFHHGVVASTHLFGKNRNKYFIFCNLLLQKTTLKTFISYSLKMMNLCVSLLKVGPLNFTMVAVVMTDERDKRNISNFITYAGKRHSHRRKSASFKLKPVRLPRSRCFIAPWSWSLS